MSTFEFNNTTPSPVSDGYTEQSPWSFTQMDTEFVIFCFIFGLALLFYLAYSPYFIGWLTKLILKRFILSSLLLNNGENDNHYNSKYQGGYTFDIGTVSIAWLSGTIFAHKIEIRTQQFVVLIVEMRLSFFWWTNHIRSNDSFKDLMDDSKPYRVQLKLVGLECILYANKSRFDELRNIVENQRLQEAKRKESEYNMNINNNNNNSNNINLSDNEQDVNIIIDENINNKHKSPSIYTLKSSPYSTQKSIKKSNQKNTESKNEMDDDDDEDNEVSLGDTINYQFDQDGKSKSSNNSTKSNKTANTSKKQESVTMSVDENNHLLLKNRKSNNSKKAGGDNNNNNNNNSNKEENAIIRELKQHIESLTPHWFFELCPVSRIGLEKVCIVVGNSNVEKYLVGSFKESEMLFYTEKNDTESTIHPYKYSLIGKMWDTNVRFTKNEDFRYDLQNLISKTAQNRTGPMGTAKSRGQNKQIAEADYITDTIYLFDKLLPRSSMLDTHHSRKHKKKDKNVQIGPLTQDNLQINRDGYNDDGDNNNLSPTNPFMLPQYKTMREIHENSPMSRTSSAGDSSKRSSKKSKDKKRKKSKSKSKKDRDKSKDKKRHLSVFGGGNKSSNNNKDKKSRKSSKNKANRSNNNPGIEGNNDGYQYNMVSTTRPPSTKTGASSVTTNDDNKTFITHSSHYTHSSQRSHQPYTYYNPTNNRSHHRHHTAGTHTTDNTISNSGETNGSASLEMAESQQQQQGIAQHTLNVPGYNRSNTNITVKINQSTDSVIYPTNPNSPNASTPPISSFYPKFQSVC